MSPDDVRATVLAVAHYVHVRRWKELQELFAGTVAVDHTSLKRAHYLECARSPATKHETNPSAIEPSSSMAGLKMPTFIPTA